MSKHRPPLQSAKFDLMSAEELKSYYDAWHPGTWCSGPGITICELILSLCEHRNIDTSDWRK